MDLFHEVNQARARLVSMGNEPRYIFLGRVQRDQLKIWFKEYPYRQMADVVKFDDCDFTLYNMRGYFVNAESLLRVTN